MKTKLDKTGLKVMIAIIIALLFAVYVFKIGQSYDTVLFLVEQQNSTVVAAPIPSLSVEVDQQVQSSNTQNEQHRISLDDDKDIVDNVRERTIKNYDLPTEAPYPPPQDNPIEDGYPAP